MKHLQTYNESLRDQMTGKSEEEILNLYDVKLKRIMNSDSHYEIIENYFHEMNGDYDEYESGREDIIEDIVRLISDEEFENAIKKLLKRDIIDKSK